VNVDFAGLSFHVPAEVLCANPVCGEAIANTKPVSSALVVKVSMACRFIFFLLASRIGLFGEGRPDPSDRRRPLLRQQELYGIPLVIY
jgi:hypothetical protein